MMMLPVFVNLEQGETLLFKHSEVPVVSRKASFFRRTVLYYLVLITINLAKGTANLLLYLFKRERKISAVGGVHPSYLS